MTNARKPHPHAAAAGAPGASGPGDPAYDGEATIGDEPGHDHVLDEAANATTPPPEVAAKVAEVDQLVDAHDEERRDSA